MRDDRSLGKERFLEDIIEDRINKGFDTFSRKLKIFEDTFYGRQYPIPHGRIDLLCEDIDRKNLVVIELKKENSDHKVVEQIQTYVDYVKNNIAKSGQKVSGIICLSEASDDLKSAIGNYPNIEIFRYSFQLEHVKI
jgi:RecB family endonuclease NucS